MITEEVFVRFSDFSSKFTCVFNRVEIEAFGEAYTVIDNIFPNIGEYTLEQIGDQIFLTTAEPLPCVNCQ